MADVAEGSTGGGGTRSGEWFSGRRRLLVVLGVAAVVLIVVYVASSAYTERSAFCVTCHEMQPYYDAWASGGHRNVSCIDCHVDPGVIAHGLHKFVALKEVWDHFTTSPRFPSYGVDLPNPRCLRCHPIVSYTGTSRFSHALHEQKALCRECHDTVGHDVTVEALRAAGVLSASPPPRPGPPAKGSAIPGHLTVSCQRCHDQVKMRCGDCHRAPHAARKQDCSFCHRPGWTFAFVHPAAADCRECHTPPAKHFPGPCNACHSPTTPFAQTAFNHPVELGEHSYLSFPCVKCHPNGYRTASCTCHPGGRPPSGD